MHEAEPQCPECGTFSGIVWAPATRMWTCTPCGALFATLTIVEKSDPDYKDPWRCRDCGKRLLGQGYEYKFHNLRRVCKPCFVVVKRAEEGWTKALNTLLTGPPKLTPWG